jgi:hypothetical protein
MYGMDEETIERLRKLQESRSGYEQDKKGTWTECRVPDGPHKGDINEYGWCEGHRYPSDRCNVVRNGDQYICRYHHRYWSTGICPGLQGPFA